MSLGDLYFFISSLIYHSSQYMYTQYILYLAVLNNKFNMNIIYIHIFSINLISIYLSFHLCRLVSIYLSIYLSSLPGMVDGNRLLCLPICPGHLQHDCPGVCVCVFVWLVCVFLCCVCLRFCVVCVCVCFVFD